VKTRWDFVRVNLGKLLFNFAFAYFALPISEVPSLLQPFSHCQSRGS
jgi:hypothetical protein